MSEDVREKVADPRVHARLLALRHSCNATDDGSV
jgi:hypothetical protein